MIKRSCKGNPCIGFLKAQVDEIRPELTWNDCFVMGVQSARRLTLEELQKKSQELKRKKRSIPADAQHPTAVQISIDEAFIDDVDEFEENTKIALELARLQSGLEFELLLYIVLDNLKSQAMLVGESETSEKTEDLNGPEMVKRLVEILMLNRDQDKAVIEEVKSALLKWEG